MNRVYLLLGSNLGDRLSNLRLALQEIAAGIGDVVCQSSVYETAPWGEVKQADYLNLAVVAATSLSAQEVLKGILQIEKTMGRVRSGKWQERIIDIDVLLYNEEVIETPQLSIPHPYMYLRKFTLAPLSEICPDYVHPVYKKSIQELLDDCEDRLAVKKLTAIGNKI